MASTITALFDSRADAEAAKQRLQDARIDADHVHIHDQSSSGYREDAYSTHQDRGVWASIKNAFVPDEDRHTYEEGIRRGGVLLTADVDDHHVDDAVRVLEEANSVDIDDRSNQWRSSGWDYAGASAGTGAGYAAGTTGSTGAGYAAGTTGSTGAGYGEGTTGSTGGSVLGAMGRDDTRDRIGSDEQVIPIVEEQLVVGKRDVSRGSVRVRSYVTETPVHEQVRLHNERVDVERVPVDQPLSAGDTDAFRERTISVTATGEEAVVGKSARVVEEVVVSKSAEDRVEEVNDTVRRTEVDIDRDTDIDRDGDGFRSGSTTGTDRY